jgi:hypothetical protein
VKSRYRQLRRRSRTRSLLSRGTVLDGYRYRLTCPRLDSDGAREMGGDKLDRGISPTMTMSSIVDAIGNTPLVELARLTSNLSGRILAKLEYLNPGFSKKDRAALGIIEEACRLGVLRPGQTVVELTSGNMGAVRRSYAP